MLHYRIQARSIYHDVDSVDDFACYLEDIVQAIKTEENISDCCLQPMTKPKLVNICLTELIVKMSTSIKFYSKLVFKSLKDDTSVSVELCCAVLCCAVLCCAVLCCAELCCAVLYCLYCTVLH